MATQMNPEQKRMTKAVSMLMELIFTTREFTVTNQTEEGVTQYFIQPANRTKKPLIETDTVSASCAFPIKMSDKGDEIGTMCLIDCSTKMQISITLF